MKDRCHDEAVAEMFARDPAFAVEFLNEVLADGDHAELLVALRQLSKLLRVSGEWGRGASFGP